MKESLDEQVFVPPSSLLLLIGRDGRGQIVEHATHSRVVR